MIINKESSVPNSLSIPSIASFLVRVKSKEEIPEIDDFASKIGLPLWVIGEGTNIVPRDYIKAVLVILDFKGIEAHNNRLKIQAGERWDGIVKFAVEDDLTGIEALSSIPGKAGAAPVQNIGAYGSEISDCLESVEVYDRIKKEFTVLSKKECQFGYRSSLFKKYPENFIVVSITLKLSKESPKIPNYKDIGKYFSERDNDYPNLKEIREAIIKIRSGKLPDPDIIPNAGSYFINPILEGKKFSAGQLIEEAGLKGAKIGEVEISPNNAMILTNPNRASFDEIMKAENFIRKEIFQKFGILLEREPRII
jgi:UDP-N-acetylmuramate dehydrogenase